MHGLPEKYFSWTVHGNCAWSPAIYKQSQGLDFGYKIWLAGLASLKYSCAQPLYIGCVRDKAGLDSTVCMAGLVSMQGLSWGTINSVTCSYTFIKLSIIKIRLGFTSSNFDYC